MKFLPSVLATASWGYGGLVGAVPPPPEQSAANCAAPTYASDQLVCADPALVALDRRMVELLAAAGPPAEAPPLPGFEPQQDWFRRRSLCAFSERHATCLRAAYRERIDLLATLARRASGRRRPALPASCPGAPWGDGPVRLQETEHGTLLIADGQGTLLGVASALVPRDGWSPFIRFDIEEGGVRLETLGGAVVRCRVHRPQ